MRIQNRILWGIVSITLASAALAQQVVVISEGEAEGAGFFQPYENRRHPKGTDGADRPDSAGGAKSLKVTLTNTNFQEDREDNPLCNSDVTPACGGFGGIAFQKAGYTDSIAQIAGLGTFTFDFFDSDQATQPLSLKIGCIKSSGVLSLFTDIARQRNNAWRSIAVDLGSELFQRGGTNQTLLDWGESWCGAAAIQKTFEIFVSVGNHRYNPTADEEYYFDRFQVGTNSPTYDFDLPEDVELPEAEEPVFATSVPSLPTLGIGALIALVMWRARRSLI